KAGERAHGERVHARDPKVEAIRCGTAAAHADLQPIRPCPEGIGMSDPSDLKAFDLSPERGVLPDPDPCRALPAQLARWDALAADLAKLLAAGRVRAALRALPVLDPAGLSGEGPLRRAMVVLSYFGHAFVWGGAEPEGVIPAPVAVPWCAVAARLGRP